VGGGWGVGGGGGGGGGGATPPIPSLPQPPLSLPQTPSHISNADSVLISREKRTCESLVLVFQRRNFASFFRIDV
jgi:hypothetical protein